MVDSISLSWALLPTRIDAKHQAIVDDSLNCWDRLSARNRSRCRSASLHEIILFQISFASWMWPTSMVRLRVCTCISCYPILDSANDACVCARSSPACPCICARLPCKGDRRKFSWKFVKTTCTSVSYVNDNYVVHLIHVRRFIVTQSVLM